MMSQVQPEHGTMSIEYKAVVSRRCLRETETDFKAVSFCYMTDTLA